MENGKFFKCEKCGKLVAIVLSGDGELVCCGIPMTMLIANSVDASKEKHVPVAVKNNGKLDVSVGSVLHPMTSEHYIMWIALVNESKTEIIYLTPGKEPKAQFLYHVHTSHAQIINDSSDEDIVPNCEGSPCNFSYNEIIEDSAEIYAYCNLHGLWKVKI